MKEERNRVYIRSCKMVLWPIRARVLFELFYNIELKHTCRVQYCLPILCHPFHWALKNVADLTQFLECQHPWFDILRKRKPRIWHEIYKSPRVPHWHKIVWIVKDNSICLIFWKKSGHLAVWKLWPATGHITKACN